MSDLSDFIAEMDRDEENRKIEDEKYFQASDEKFQEMQKRLQLLKEENKRQIDIIMNSLDELIANKTVIDKALENADEIEPIVNDDNLSIVDLLAKVTGYVNDIEMKNEIREITNNFSLICENPDDVASNDEEINNEEKNDAEKNDEEKNDKEKNDEEKNGENKNNVEKIDQVDINETMPDIKGCEMKDGSEEVPKNEDTQVKSKIENENKEKETESICDSTKLLEKLNIGSSDDKNHIKSDEKK